MAYKYLVFDLDDTLLGSDRSLAEGSVKAIEKAYENGKEIILATGRSIKETEMYLDRMPHVRYLILSNGSHVFDYKEKKDIFHTGIPAKVVSQLVKWSKPYDVILRFLGPSVVEHRKIDLLDSHFMGKYKKIINDYCLHVDDMEEYFDANPTPVEKIDVYLKDPDTFKIFGEFLSTLDLNYVHTEFFAYETSATGISKKTGFLKLCEYAGLDPKEMIAVGDSGNDLDIIHLAGFGIAVGNAVERVKAIADAVVRDCDHGGAEDAIYQYLLK